MNDYELDFLRRRNDTIINGLCSLSSNVTNNNLKLAIIITLIYVFVQSMEVEAPCVPDISFIQQMLNKCFGCSNELNGQIDVFDAMKSIVGTDNVDSPEKICNKIVFMALAKNNNDEAQAILNKLFDSINDKTEFSVQKEMMEWGKKELHEILEIKEDEGQ